MSFLKATFSTCFVSEVLHWSVTGCQVRVVQGKEPAHFRQLFKGKMVVHSGGKASGFKNRSEEDR
jgi:hypothetical protein